MDSLMKDYVFFTQTIDQSREVNEKPKAPVAWDGKQLVKFRLFDLEGNAFSHQGSDSGLLLLDFWFRNCLPCLAAMPAMEDLHREFSAQGLTVKGINPIDNEAESLLALLAKKGVTFGTLLDPGRIVTEQIGVQGFPTVLLIDRSTSQILYGHTGAGKTVKDELRAAIEAHLKK
jgi:thiol-disulfide isomerase/thioredoxin